MLKRFPKVLTAGHRLNFSISVTLIPLQQNVLIVVKKNGI